MSRSSIFLLICFMFFHWPRSAWAAEGHYDLGGACKDVQGAGVFSKIVQAKKSGSWDQAIELEKANVREQCSNEYRWCELVSALLEDHRQTEAVQVLQEMESRGFDLNPSIIGRSHPDVEKFMETHSSASSPPDQTQSPAVTPKFEVASIRQCKDDFGSGYRGERGTPSPDRFDLRCQPLRAFIVRAYVYYRDGHFSLLRSLPVIQGAPDWLDDRYSITAKAEGIAGEGIMHGPMLQTLLEDRFKLKIHRETREIPVYELTVTKGGLKAPRFVGGICTPFDWNRPLPGPEPEPIPKHCIDRITGKGANVIVQLDAMSIDGFIKFFLHRLDRPVIDKTGLTGLFDFHLEYTPDQAGPVDFAGASIFTALQQQLGLKLTPSKGPGELLVIDHVERPSEN